LAFHAARDPFSEPFDDEEVVVDSFAPVQPHDGSSHRDAAAGDDKDQTIPFHVSGGSASEERPKSGQEDLAVVQPDQIRESIAESMCDAADSMNSLPGDDRDLLDIRDTPGEMSVGHVMSFEERAPRRRDYRQLFGCLRRP
jgi:hypothetical protein